MHGPRRSPGCSRTSGARPRIRDRASRTLVRPARRAGTRRRVPAGPVRRRPPAARPRRARRLRPREPSPGSDVDLLILHDGSNAPEWPRSPSASCTRCGTRACAWVMPCERPPNASTPRPGWTSATAMLDGRLLAGDRVAWSRTRRRRARARTRRPRRLRRRASSTTPGSSRPLRIRVLAARARREGGDGRAPRRPGPRLARARDRLAARGGGIVRAAERGAVAAEEFLVRVRARSTWRAVTARTGSSWSSSRRSPRAWGSSTSRVCRRRRPHARRLRARAAARARRDLGVRPVPARAVAAARDRADARGDPARVRRRRCASGA